MALPRCAGMHREKKGEHYETMDLYAFVPALHSRFPDLLRKERGGKPIFFREHHRHNGKFIQWKRGFQQCADPARPDGDPEEHFARGYAAAHLSAGLYGACPAANQYAGAGIVLKHSIMKGSAGKPTLYFVRYNVTRPALPPQPDAHRGNRRFSSRWTG